MLTILLVEDEALIRELLQEVFEAEGFIVRTAADGAEAIDLLDADCPEVLVTDINLGPGPDGFEVARRARDARPDVIVFHVTAHAAHLGHEGVPGSIMVPKPFDVTYLARRVRARCEEAARAAFMAMNPHRPDVLRGPRRSSGGC